MKKPEKVVVAVHGMGDQTKYKTLQDVVNMAFGQEGKPMGVPIGRLHSGLEGTGSSGGNAAWTVLPVKQKIGFAEVFWADVGRENEEYVLEDLVRWTDTIVERLNVIDGRLKTASQEKGIDRRRIQRVLRDIAHVIKLIRLGNSGLTKLGMGSEDLDQLLMRYLGDVQLFSEFRGPRNKITQRFHEQMTRIDRKAGEDDVEIHICAHSWGTVVSFLGILEGYEQNAPWLKRVRSFMTFGSPIDKALILWPELWSSFPGHKGEARDPSELIRWYNYSDRGDPVGYELDTAAEYLKRLPTQLFVNDKAEERVYRRYCIPGKAHIDYFGDQEIFNEWLAEGVGIGPKPKKPIGNKSLAEIFGPILLFLLPFLFAFAAAFSLGSAINAIRAAAREQPLFDGFVATTTLLLYGSLGLGSVVTKNIGWRIFGGVCFASGAALSIDASQNAPLAWYASAILLITSLVSAYVPSSEDQVRG